MLTRQEAERLAQAINALHPSWPVASLLTTIHKRKERPLLDLALELTYVALDPDSQSPARIDVDGPWKRLRHSPTAVVPNYRQISDNDCGICSRPFALHSSLSKLDDHDYEPRNLRGHGERPTDEVRARIDEAAEAARLARTNTRETNPEHTQPTEETA